MDALTGEVLSTDTKYKAVSFIETFTGKTFFPMSPRAEDFSIIDIAHHLSNDCRYSGATKEFYSTAQHCCLLTDYVTTTLKMSAQDGLQILIHDGAEAYLRDIPRPIKQFLPDYRKWDHAVTMALRQWIGLGSVPIPSWQDEFDSRIIADERAQVMGDTDNDWQHNVEPLGIVIEPWGQRRAEQEFLMRYAALSKEVFGCWRYLRSGWGIPTRAIFTPFQSGHTDRPRISDEQPGIVTDLLEVDLIGDVGRVVLRSPDGILMRDTAAGTFPRPAWRFMHGKFDLTLTGEDNGLANRE